MQYKDFSGLELKVNNCTVLTSCSRHIYARITSPRNATYPLLWEKYHGGYSCVTLKKWGKNTSDSTKIICHTWWNFWCWKKANEWEKQGMTVRWSKIEVYYFSHLSMAQLSQPLVDSGRFILMVLFKHISCPWVVPPVHKTYILL